MNNNFKESFENFLAEIHSDTLVRLKKENTHYANIISKYAKLYSAVTEQTNITNDMINELILLDLEKDDIEKSAIYIQGFSDCIQILNQYGWIN